MDRNKDLVTINRADITILDQEVFGILGEVMGFKLCWGKLWISERLDRI